MCHRRESERDKLPWEFRVLSNATGYVAREDSDPRLPLDASEETDQEQ